MGGQNKKSQTADRTVPEITVQVDREKGVAEICIPGRVNLPSLLAGFAKFCEQPRDFHFRGFVWDFRTADLSEIDFPALRDALPRNTVALLARGRIRAAAVVRDGGDRGLAELWAAVGTTIDTVEREVFHDIHTAREWVGENLEGGLPPDPTAGWMADK